jgi:hypothetical protein
MERTMTMNLNQQLARKPDAPESEYVKRLRDKAENRRLYQHDVAPLLGLSEPMIVQVRVPSYRETIAAQASARAFVDRHAVGTDEAKTAFRTDPESVEDAKAAAIVQVAVREADGVHSAWPSVDFIATHFTADQIASIVSLVVRARVLEAGGQPEINPEELERLVSAVTAATPEHAAELLSVFPRESLATLVILLSSRIALERRLAQAQTQT